MFSIPLLYILEKNLLVNKHEKQMCFARKINLCFFDVMKNGQVFPLKVFHFQYDKILLFSREMKKIRS